MSFTLSKTQIVAGSTGNVINVTGSSGPFTASGPGTITSQSTGQFTITGGAAYGIITISDGTSTAQLVNAPAGTKAISYDNFNRANTSPGGVGNGWIDNGSYWEILSNTANCASPQNGYNNSRLMRPESEQFVNGSVRVHFTNQGSSQFQLLARISETSDGNGDALSLLFIPGNAVFLGYWSGGTFDFAQAQCTPTLPNEGWAELVFNGQNVTANLYAADGVTPIANGSCSITSTPVVGAGSVGFNATYGGWSAQIVEIDAFETQSIVATPPVFKSGVSTTLAITGIGTSFNGSSISATNATISSQSASSGTAASVTLTATNVGPVVLTDTLSGAQFTVNAIDPLTVVYDIFNRANTSVGSGANSTNMGSPTYYYSPSIGGSWIDYEGSNWNIQSNVATSVGSIATSDINGALYRPSSENMVNGKSQLIFNNNFGNTAFSKYETLLGRFTPASGGSGYGATLNASFQNAYVNFVKQVNGTATTFASIPINQQFLPAANLLLEFCVQQKNSTTTTLTFNIYNPSAPPPTNAPIYSYSYDDTTTALQNVAGSFGGAGVSPQADTVLATVAMPSALTIGKLVVNEVYKTNAYLGVSEIAGGMPPYTVQYYRSTTNGFTPGPGNAISGQTSAYVHDSGLSPGSTYYGSVTVTDSLGATATTNQVSFTTLPSSALIIGVPGDSISAGFNVASEPQASVNQMSLALTAAGIQNVCINVAVSGSASGQWTPGQPNYNYAVSAWSGRDVSLISYMIGTNDAKGSESQSTYSGYVSSSCAAWEALGWPTILHYSPWNSDGSTEQGFLLQYEAAINALVNGTTILQGDTTAYTQFEANPSWLADGVHPNATGAYHLGNFWATAIKNNFFGTLTPPVITVGAITGTTASLTATAASGGVGPYTYQWYRSTTSGFTPGPSNILAGQTSLTLNDTGLTGNTTYYYKIKATDSTTPTALVAISNQASALTAPTIAPTVTIAPYASGVAVSWSTSDTGVTFNINHNGTVTNNVTSPDDFVVADLTQSNYWKVQSVNATGAGPFSNAVYLGGSGGGSSGGGINISPFWGQ